jgi:hypothetical protein
MCHNTLHHIKLSMLYPFFFRTLCRRFRVAAFFQLHTNCRLEVPMFGSRSWVCAESKILNIVLPISKKGVEKLRSTKKGIGLIVTVIVLIGVFTVATPASASNQNFTYRGDDSGFSIEATIKGDGPVDRPHLLQNFGQEGVELVVNKTVFDPTTGEWVKTRTADLNDEVNFNIVIILKDYHSFCGGDLSMIVDDVSSSNLLIFGEPSINLSIDLTNLTININFSAQVVGCGVGTNNVNATFMCADPEATLTEEDMVTVDILCPTPILTPLGLIALVGLLSTIAAVTLVRKRR